MVKTFCKNPPLISEFNQLPVSHNLEITIVDDKSLEVIVRIEKLLSAFEPMGVDELRYVYIEAVRHDRRLVYIRGIQEEDWRKDEGVEEEMEIQTSICKGMVSDRRQAL